MDCALQPQPVAVDVHRIEHFIPEVSISWEICEIKSDSHTFLIHVIGGVEEIHFLIQCIRSSLDGTDKLT